MGVRPFHLRDGLLLFCVRVAAAVNPYSQACEVQALGLQTLGRCNVGQKTGGTPPVISFRSRPKNSNEALPG